MDGWEHRFAVRVYFEDTDFTGRVYHGAYVRFLERGRTEMLREAGLDHAGLAALDPAAFFTVRKMSLAFHAPAAIDDSLWVVTRPSAPPRATIRLSQEIHGAAGRLVSAQVELCVIDARGRPVRPTGEIRAVFTS